MWEWPTAQNLCFCYFCSLKLLRNLKNKQAKTDHRFIIIIIIIIITTTAAIKHLYLPTSVTWQSRTSYVINHSHGSGWAKTCITPHFSSQISSRLLFRAHTSYQSLSVLEWSTDISLTVEPRRRYDSHRLFTTPISARLKGKKRKNTSGSIAAFPAVNYHQLFVGKQSAPDLTMSVEHRDGATDGGFSLRSRWVSCTLDPVFLFCPGHCRHPINANMLKYTLTQSPSPPYPHIFLHLCLPLT